MSSNFSTPLRFPRVRRRLTYGSCEPEINLREEIRKLKERLDVLEAVVEAPPPPPPPLQVRYLRKNCSCKKTKNPARA